jgi:hypothetical protein
MKIIAHRGNVEGVNTPYENTIDYLKYAFSIGFDIECDLIGYNGILYFGHDEPLQVADLNFLQQPGVWAHAKNTSAIELLSTMRTHYFWHENDAATVTSQGYIWCYPKHYVNSKKAVWLDVFGNTLPKDLSNIYGICTDNAKTYTKEPK